MAVEKTLANNPEGYNQGFIQGGLGIFPPPETLKFSIVFGHLVCVIKIIEILSRIASEAILTFSWGACPQTP